MSTHTEITWCTRFYSLLPFKGRRTFITIHPFFLKAIDNNFMPISLHWNRNILTSLKHHNQTINCAHGSRLARKSSCDLRKEKSIFDYKFHAILQNTFAFSYVCCSSFVVWLFTHSLSIYLMPSLVTSTADPMQLISFQNKKSMLCLACMKIHQ